MQSPKARREVYALLPNNPNPFVPPTGNTCYINNLPPELLSRIFAVGTLDDDGGADAWIQGCYEALGEEYKSGADNDVEIMMADDKKVDVAFQEFEEEEEGDDEEWTDTTGASDFNFGVDSPSPPFHIVVSHVCRHWGSVALSTPSLWTTIEITSDARPPYENVSILLERSKAVPIDIEIYYIPHGDSNTQDNLKILCSLLVPHVQRWRSIKVTTLSSRSMDTFLSAVSDPSVPAASQLATLQLYNSATLDKFENPLVSNHLTLFGGSAPNLTTLTLQGVHVDWNQGWIASASNLRYLKLAWHKEEVRPTWAQFATILHGAPQLNTLRLSLSEPTGALDAPIQLLNLTDFVLVSESPSHAMGLFPKFYLPSLTSLTLHLDGGDFTDLIDQLAGPVTSLSPLSAEEQPRSLLSSLEKLKIMALPCRNEGAETLYSELQNLQSLDIIPGDLLPQFVDLLCQPCTLPGRGDIWLPRLKSLWICNGPGDLIRRVVQKRKDAGVPLKALYVDDECDVGADDVEWFRENVETFDFFDGWDLD